MNPFHRPAFRRLWVSSLSSSGAQGMERTATAWLTLEAGGGAFAIGLVFAARMLPSLLFGLAAGTFADRGERSRQLLAVGASAWLLMAALGAIISHGTVAVWQILAFAFAAGCVQTFDTPARQALVLDLVPVDSAERALALNALAGRLAMVLGAFAAGALIPFAGTARCYFVIAAVHSVTAIMAATLPVARERRSAAELPPFGRAIRDAARLIVDIPAVRTLITAGIACEVFAFSYATALPIMAEKVLHTGAEGLGTLNAAVSLGGLVAVILLALLPRKTRREPLLGAAFVGYGLSLLAVAMTGSLLLAAAILVLTGLCAGAFDVLQQTLIQLAVPREQRGRAVGVWVLGLGSAPVGHIEMGLLVALLGAREALSINAALTLIAALILLARAPSFRWLGRTRQLPAL